MKISVLVLTETPREINAFDFNLSDPNVNSALYKNITTKKKYKVVRAIGPHKLYAGSSEYIMVDVDESKIVYYMQWKDVSHALIGSKAASQIAVWYPGAPGLQGTPKDIFFNYLLPTHDAIITDSVQTPDGRRFWGNRISDAWQMGLHVYYVNLLQSAETGKPEILEIKDDADFRHIDKIRGIWGTTQKFQARKIVITSNPLARSTQVADK